MEYQYFRTFLSYIRIIFSDVAIVGNWLVTPTSFGMSPLLLISVSGLIAYLTVAIVRWLI